MSVSIADKTINGCASRLTKPSTSSRRSTGRCVKKYGHESALVYTGMGRNGGVTSGSNLAALTFNTPNYCYTQSGYACYLPRMAASVYTSGIAYTEVDYAGTLEGRYDDPSRSPEVIVLWGKSLLESDGLFGHSIIDMMKRGAKLITVDPRVNWVSTRAEYHLRLRPGTDAALGMAMCDTIIQGGLYDHEFAVLLWLRRIRRALRHHARRSRRDYGRSRGRHPRRCAAVRERCPGDRCWPIEVVGFG